MWARMRHAFRALSLSALLVTACTTGPRDDDENTISFEETPPKPRDGGLAVRFDAGEITEHVQSSSSAPSSTPESVSSSTSLAPPQSSSSAAPQSSSTSMAATSTVMIASSSAPAATSSAPPVSSSTSSAPVSSTSASLAPSSSSAGVSSSSSSTPPQRAYIWAHSDVNMYLLDLDTVTATGQTSFTDQGAITWLNESNQPLTGGDALTDLAINSAGEAYGCSFTHLYHLDLTSLAVKARRVAPLAEGFNALTFVPAGTLDPAQEVLVGTAAGTDMLYRINVVTGSTAIIGHYGGGYISSGDIVAVQGVGVFATVKVDGSTAADKLASINPTTGAATIIGSNIGYASLWGLGYWNGVLYGFGSDGRIISIDPTTGRGAVYQAWSATYWGAGVTTHARIP